MNNARRNWKTTVAGILGLAFLGLDVYQTVRLNPAALLEPAKQAEVLAKATLSAGLIAAKDGDKTGTGKDDPASN